MSDKLPLHLVPGGNSARHSEVAHLRAEVESRDRQQTAITELGQAALTGVDPYILLGQACALVELTLGVYHWRAIEITAGGRAALRAAIGSNPTFLHCERDDEENESLAMFVTLTGTPVTFSDLENETRFKCSHLRGYHGIRSGAGITIPRPAGVFGALLAYSNDERTFEEHEIGFLRATASLLGEALQRARTEEALHKSESRLKQLIASTLDAVLTIDRDGNVIEWNPQAEATFGIKARSIVGGPLPRAIIPPPCTDIFAASLNRYAPARPPALCRARSRPLTAAPSGTEV